MDIVLQSKHKAWTSPLKSELFCKHIKLLSLNYFQGAHISSAVYTNQALGFQSYLMGTEYNGCVL